MSVIVEIGTPVDDDLDQLSYASYSARGDAPIPEADWPGWRAESWRVLRQLTQSQVDDLTTDADLETLREALCLTADALYSVKTGVTSERIGSYAYTVGSQLTTRDAYRVATDALSGLGITYRGL